MRILDHHFKREHSSRRQLCSLLSLCHSYKCSLPYCQVNIYTLSSSGTSHTLQLVSAWNHNYIVTHVASIGNRVVVMDQIASLAAVDISPADWKMTTVARNYSPLYPVCVEVADKENFVGANVGACLPLCDQL
jgi:DNA damage-binding protein 1